MDPDYRGFRLPNPFKVTDLSGVIPDTRTTRPGSEQSISSGSTEFQAALDPFSRMKINETKRQEEETTKSVEESIDTKKLVQRRQSLSEFASVDMAKAVSIVGLRIKNVANLCHPLDLLQWICNTASPPLRRIPDRMVSPQPWRVIQRRASYTELMKF